MADTAEIRSVLERQAACWNRGELAPYLSFYTNDAVYVAAGGALLQGRDAIGGALVEKYGFLDRRLGSLSYSDLFVRTMGAGLAMAVGKYRLAAREEKASDQAGFFSVVLRQEPEGWRILLDHPS